MAVMISIAKALEREDIVREIYDSKLYMPNNKVLGVFNKVIKENPLGLQDKIIELEKIEKLKDGDTRIKISSKESTEIDRIVENMIRI